jgi:hypothetical protein
MAFRIASGSMLGPDQPVILQLLEITPALQALQGVVMELNDCAFPLLAGVATATDNLEDRVQGRRTTRCWSAPGRAGPAWNARTCCRPTARFSDRRARP